jgi:RING finger/CHY zinc finger protein 1
MPIRSSKVHLNCLQMVAHTAMPQEYRDVKVQVMCNDCQARSEAPFHVVGYKCSGCGGYNTRRI